MGAPIYEANHACRSCGSGSLSEVLDLGMHALSTFRERLDEPLEKAPLVMVRCENCTLVQLGHTVDRDRLYSRYWYKSGTNETMILALRDVVDDACSSVHLDGVGDFWLDIGANDGTLLKHVRALTSCTAQGIDPTPQDSSIALGYFPEDIPTFWLDYLRFKVITSVAQFYNVEDPNAYVAAIKRILHPDGVWVVQMQDLASVYRDRAFDYICHEHLALWEPMSFDRLLSGYGLEIAAVSYNNVNGGSVRITVRHGDSRWRGIPLQADWDLFHDDVTRNKARTMELLEGLHAQGATIAGIAASTKGNTTLQYYGIGPELVPFIGDRNPEKVGTYTPTGQKVISEEEMRDLEPDYLLALAWHFLPGFLVRENALLEQGTKFIVPMPRLNVIDAFSSLAEAA